MREIVERFISDHGNSIAEKSLYENFLLHPASLKHLSLISSRDVLELTISLQRLMVGITAKVTPNGVGFRLVQPTGWPLTIF